MRCRSRRRLQIRNSKSGIRNEEARHRTLVTGASCSSPSLERPAPSLPLHRPGAPGRRVERKAQNLGVRWQTQSDTTFNCGENVHPLIDRQFVSTPRPVADASRSDGFSRISYACGNKPIDQSQNFFPRRVSRSIIDSEFRCVFLAINSRKVRSRLLKLHVSQTKTILLIVDSPPRAIG